MLLKCKLAHIKEWMDWRKTMFPSVSTGDVNIKAATHMKYSPGGAETQIIQT